MPYEGLRAAAVAGGHPRAGWPPAVVRGAWCQALSLSRPPVPGGRMPGLAARVSRARVVWASEAQHRPHSMRSCDQVVREGFPWGGALRCCEERLRSGARPPPAAHPRSGLLESAAHLLWSPLCGRGDPALSLWLACPAGSCVPRGWWGAARGGGGVAFHCCEGRLVFGAVPLLAACPWGWAARARCPCTGGVGMGGPAPAPQRALLRAGVARCRVGGRASPGGCPASCEGSLWPGTRATRLPGPRAGCWGPPPTCCGPGRAGVGAEHCPSGSHALQGAACRRGGRRPSRRTGLPSL